MSSEDNLTTKFDTSRNWGFIDSDLQLKLSNSTVAIAGVGGVGGRIAVELTRIGVGRLVLADPDIFTATNLNRQEGSYTSTLNQNKARVIADICRDINPAVRIAIYEDGITTGNIEKFIAGADVLVEATDYALPHLGVMLARTARSHNIPMITGVEMGFGATIAWFPPTGFTYEKHLGLDDDVTLEELKSGAKKVDIGRWVTHVPSYGDLRVLKQVVNGDQEAPAISPAVGLCSAMATTQIVSLIANSKTMPPAPAVFSVELKELKSRIIRYPYLHYRMSLLKVIIRSILNRPE